MEQEILTSAGEPFAKKGALAMALQGKGLSETHEAVEVDGGWIGKPKAIKPDEVQTQRKKPLKLIRCRVHRSNVDPDNANMQISLCVNEKSSKKVFWPGQEVELTESHLNVLRDSVDEIRLPIPPESGIYESQNPMSLAKDYYPNMTPELDASTGMITMVSKTPNYIVERL